MIHVAAKLAFREVIETLEKKIDEISEMVAEGLIDPDSTWTPETAASYLHDVVSELSLEIGQVAKLLTIPVEEVTPPESSVSVAQQQFVQ